MTIKKKLSKNKIILKSYQFLTSEYYKMLTRISPVLNTKARYKQIFKKDLDLKNPVTLNEKILKLKLDSYEFDPLIRQCADKYAVREYITKCGCSDILVPLLAVYDSPDEIDWNTLPDSFVIKWNFGCGFNIVCPNKSELDIADAVKKLKKWQKSKMYLLHSEMQYKNVKKKIIVEKYLKPEIGLLPEDYKVYCFNGKPKFIMVCVGRGELDHPKFYFFDENWNLARINKDSKAAPEGFSIDKPKCLDKLLASATKLSEPFKFVRADLYINDDKVFFGELTFTPAGALDSSRLPETDVMMGNLLNI